MQAITIDMPAEGRALVSAAEQRLSFLRAMAVTSPAEYDAAGIEIRDAAGRKKQLEAMRKDLKAPIIEAGKRIDAMFEEPMRLCDQARAILDPKMIGYQNEQLRLRQEAERRAAEAARMERERMERQAAAEREKARKEAEAAQAKIAAAEAAGKAERAEQMRQQAAEREAQRLANAEAMSAAAAAMPTNPVVDVPKPATAGISMRDNWQFEIADAAAVPREYLLVDEAKIGKVVRALKGETQIAGVRVFNKQVLAARA